LYTEATQHCARNGDHDNRLFFEELLGEEQGHASELAKWLEELKQPGVAVKTTRATF